MSEERKSPEYDLAKRKVDAIVGFKVHLGVYLAVNLFLVILNLLLLKKTGPQGEALAFPVYFWAIWPIIGWGFGVLMHYVAAAKFCSQSFAAWQEQQVQQYLEKHKAEKK
jgi:hypothetical protein